MRREGTSVKRPKRESLGPKEKREEWRVGVCCDLIMELKVMVEYWFGPSGSACSRCTKRMLMSQSKAETPAKSSDQVFVCVGLTSRYPKRAVKRHSGNYDPCTILTCRCHELEVVFEGC